jgi:hypothetical protein
MVMLFGLFLITIIIKTGREEALASLILISSVYLIFEGLLTERGQKYGEYMLSLGA